MKRNLIQRLTLTAVLFSLIQLNGFCSTQQAKNQIKFINSNLPRRISLIRQQLRQDKISLAISNIKNTTTSLEDVARYTKEIRKTDPAYSPNPPIDFNRGPAAERQKEFIKARKMAITTAKQLNVDYQNANRALLRAKERQMATIAISALKFTVENAPGTTGGKVSSVVVEGTKKLNSYLMDKYVSQPITGITEVKLLKNNFVSIRDGERLLKQLDAARRKVLDTAHQMKAQEKKLDSAVKAEKKWQKFAWLKQASAGKISVKIVDYKHRDMKLMLDGTEITPAMRGRTLNISTQPILETKVWCKRRKFCLNRKEYAKKTKTIRVHAGPGGGPEDHLIYSSTRIPAKTSWTILDESFTWKPSFNSTIEDYPRAVNPGYWKLHKARIIWKIKPKPGQNVNIYVKGNVKWKYNSNIRGRVKKKTETNTGSATLVLKILK